MINSRLANVVKLKNEQSISIEMFAVREDAGEG